MSAAENFERLVVRGDEGACWEWLGRKSTWGYAIVTAAPATYIYAHRWAHEHWVGPIPDGFQVDHLCRNKGCVNPAHLEAVTVAENISRANRQLGDDGWLCRNGHPIAGPGRCRQCADDHIERYTERRRHNGTHRRRGDPPPVLSDFQRANFERFLLENPEFPRSELRRIGIKSARTRFRYGWSYDGESWWKPTGVRVVEV